MVKVLSWFAVALCAVTLAIGAHAAEVYVVQGAATGQVVNPAAGPERAYWTTDALLYNKSDQDAVVRLLGVSNAPFSPDESSFVIPPHRSASLMTLEPTWRPGLFDSLWIVHLDIPEGVVIESVLFIGSIFATGPTIPEAHPQRYGKVRLPVVSSLSAAGQPQVHLATFLGDPAEIPSRLNVAIYNSATVVATARVELRESCDDAVLRTTNVDVPANSLIQTTVASTVAPNCLPAPGGLGGPPNGLYAVVLLDQPGFSFVSNVANTASPLTSISITSAQ